MERNLDRKTKRLALAGQLCGATLLLTLLSIPLPSGYGYVNLGDAGVFLCACLLPGGLGALAAGMALLAGLALRRAKKAGLPLSLLCCLLVPLGYFLYETILLTAPVAAVNVLPNTLQAAIGAALGTLVGRHLQALIKRK